MLNFSCIGGSSLNFTTKGCEIVFELISLPTCQFNLYVSNNNSILMQTLIAGYNPISYILLPHKNYQLFVQVENLKNEVQDELQTNICKNNYCIIYILLFILEF